MLHWLKSLFARTPACVDHDFAPCFFETTEKGMYRLDVCSTAGCGTWRIEWLETYA